MKNLGILGSTGSIGEQTLEVVRQNPKDYRVAALAVMGNTELLKKQIREFKPAIVAVFDPNKARSLKEEIIKIKAPSARIKTADKKNDDPLLTVEVLEGLEGLIAIARSSAVDLLVNSVVGSVGLVPTLKAIEAGKNIALANKETLVVAGELVMKKAAEKGILITPIDSEHSAIFQCLQGEKRESIEKIILTASGGPFRTWEKEDIAKATYRQALKHPNWEMGRKISIDSATMMNKGLEVIEARWLFDLPAEKIETVVHPESIIHSMVEYRDSSVIAELGVPDMKVPIQYALSYPERIKGDYEKLSLSKIKKLTFEEPDTERFPCLQLAYDALKVGGTMPAVLNGANEVLVEAYLQEKITFYDIPKYIKMAMEAHKPFDYTTMEEILAVDRWVRDYVRKTLL
jgi:1-deoxy-D-xylulose-5-phosphate reductoisomerase